MLPNSEINHTIGLERNDEIKQIRHALSEKRSKKPYNKDEDIKRRKRQKENYAKKQAKKGLTVRKYKKFDRENTFVRPKSTYNTFTRRKSVSICRLNFN